MMNEGFYRCLEQKVNFIFDVSDIVQYLFSDHRLSDEEIEMIFASAYHSAFWSKISNLFNDVRYGFDINTLNEHLKQNDIYKDYLDDIFDIYGVLINNQVELMLSHLPGCYSKGIRELTNISYYNGTILVEMVGR